MKCCIYILTWFLGVYSGRCGGPLGGLVTIGLRGGEGKMGKGRR